jgi:hypothetical protein
MGISRENRAALKKSVKFMSNVKENPRRNTIDAAIRKGSLTFYTISKDTNDQHHCIHELLALPHLLEENSLGYMFAVNVMFKFALDILRKYHGEDSILEKHPDFGDLILEKATRFRNMARRALWETSNPVRKHYLSEIEKKCVEIRDLYQIKTSRNYLLIQQVKTMLRIKEELIQKACHPSRVQWFLDEEEKKDIFAM